MRRESLTNYDAIPESMMNYLSHNGPHFNRKLCEYAISKMYKIKDGKKQYITAITKEELNTLLKINNVTLDNNVLYDYIYVANMCKADFLGSSIVDNRHLALYVKDVIDDTDAYDGIVFNRWYADMCYKGIPIDWEDML